MNNGITDTKIKGEIKKMKENIKEIDLTTDITFDGKITIQKRMNKENKEYQMMVIGIENKKTGEILNIHDVYIKENLRQIIEFIISQNNQ